MADAKSGERGCGPQAPEKPFTAGRLAQGAFTLIVVVALPYLLVAAVGPLLEQPFSRAGAVALGQNAVGTLMLLLALVASLLPPFALSAALSTAE